MAETPEILANSYQFLNVLGEGANGKTWRAKKLDTGEIVAVKALKLSKMDNLKSYELFVRETEVLESLHVEGVPKFYQSVFSESDDQTCYLIQEFVNSPSLDSIIRERGLLDEETTLSVMMSVCEILKELHCNYAPPVIHRDIKPSNILCKLSGSDVISLSLIDFGAVANPQKKSGSSTVAGTFGYMAPEQMLGDVSPQCDYYSLGATALHALTGVPPYEMPTDVFKLNFEDLIARHAPETSSSMLELLHVLLAPDVQQRPRSAHILMRYIRNVRRHKPILTDSTTSICDDYLRRARENISSEASIAVSDEEIGRWFLANGLVQCISAEEIEDIETARVELKRQARLEKGLPEDENSEDAEKGVGFYAEYTFDILNETQLGCCPIPRKMAKKYMSRQMPLPCVIKYDPRDPHFSLLVEIQGEKKLI